MHCSSLALCDELVTTVTVSAVYSDSILIHIRSFAASFMVSGSRYCTGTKYSMLHKNKTKISAHEPEQIHIQSLIANFVVLSSRNC